MFWIKKGYNIDTEYTTHEINVLWQWLFSKIDHKERKHLYYELQDGLYGTTPYYFAKVSRLLAQRQFNQTFYNKTVQNASILFQN